MEVQLTPLMLLFLLIVVFLFCVALPIGGFLLGLNVGIKVGSAGQRSLGGIVPGRSSLSPGNKDAAAQADGRKFSVVPGLNMAEGDPLAALDGQVDKFLTDFAKRTGRNYVDPELAGRGPKQARATGVSDE